MRYRRGSSISAISNRIQVRRKAYYSVLAASAIAFLPAFSGFLHSLQLFQRALWLGRRLIVAASKLHIDSHDRGG